MVNEIVAAETAGRRARSSSRREIAANAPLSLAGNKRVIRALLAAEGALDPAIEASSSRCARRASAARTSTKACARSPRSARRDGRDAKSRDVVRLHAVPGHCAGARAAASPLLVALGPGRALTRRRRPAGPIAAAATRALHRAASPSSRSPGAAPRARSARTARPPRARRAAPASRARLLDLGPVLNRTPNRGWRRWGTDRLVRTRAPCCTRTGTPHPGAPRVGIGDLSRPHGGFFGGRLRRARPRVAPERARRRRLLPAPRRPRAARRCALAGRPRARPGPRRPLRRARARSRSSSARACSLKGPAGSSRRSLHHDDHLHVRIRNVRR